MKDQPATRSQQPKDLGNQVRVFKQRIPLNWWALLFLSILGGVVVWYWASMTAASEGISHGTIIANRVLVWGVGGLLVFGLIALLSLAGLVLYPRFRLIFYEKGFSYQTKNYFTNAEWQEITGIQVDFQRLWWMIFLIRRQDLTLHLFNGSTITLTHYLEKMDLVKAELEKQIFPLVMDQMRSGYEQGAVIQFGPILLSKANGLKFQNMVIRWESIHTMSVDDGWLSVKFYAPGGALEELHCPVKDIINLSVMLTIIRERLKQDGD
jgi:hypothetical protein